MFQRDFKFRLKLHNGTRPRISAKKTGCKKKRGTPTYLPVLKQQHKLQMQTLTKQTVSQVAAKKEEADVRAKIRTTLIYSTPDFATPKPLLEPMVCNYAGVLEKKKNPSSILNYPPHSTHPRRAHCTRTPFICGLPNVYC